MSYILEALQRADRERKRVRPPTLEHVLHAESTAGSRVRRRWWFGLALLLTAGLGWWYGHSGTEQGRTQTSLPQQVAPPVVVRETTTISPRVPERTVRSGGKRDMTPEHRSPSASHKPVVSKLAAPEPEAPPRPVVVVPEATRPTGGSPQGAVPFARLSPEIRALLPELHISALIDHSDPARRVAMINGRTLHIGAWVTGDVRLVALTAERVTLEFRGVRFTMTPFDGGS